MSLTGDFGQLDGLMQCMSELSHVPSRTAKAVSLTLEKELQDEFDSGVDPYGNSWKPLAPSTIARGRAAPPLTDTSVMRDSLRVHPLGGAGVGIEIDHPAGVHQTGWNGPLSSGPARPILPDAGVLPEGWVEIIETAAELEFERAVRKR